MNGSTRAGWLSLSLCLVVLASPAFADNRGVKVSGKTPAEFFAQQTGKSYAVVIGINDYEKVRRLTYAEADAKAVAETLKQRGFQVTALYNRQATRNAILDELGDKLVERGATEVEVVAVVRTGESFSGKFGRTGFRKTFPSNPRGLETFMSTKKWKCSRCAMGRIGL